MKQYLVVSSCTTRGNSGGLTAGLINHLNSVKNGYFEISLFDIGFFNYNRCIDAYDIKEYFVFPTYSIDRLIRKIPLIRGYYAERIITKALDKLLRNNHFDLIIIHEIPAFADKIVSIAHKYGAKVVFYPWGSDILRRTNKIKKRLKNAFNEVDYVTGNIGSNCTISVIDDYGVSKSKLRLKKKMFLKGIKAIDEVKGMYSKQDMLKRIGLPPSDYIIVCGYNGYSAQRHKLIIESVCDNYSVLPDNYLLVFPITYGCNEQYYNELNELCENNNVNACFLREYLTDEQMALLHLSTDLFIEIQPTDCGNAFMIEALYANNQIITGKWLKYKQFEQFGPPYYLIDKPEDLSKQLHLIFTGEEQSVVVPEKLKNLYKYPTMSQEDDIWVSLACEL